MKINIIKDDNNDKVGYDLVPETEEDHNNLGQVRNMLFFGFGDTTIKYAGRECKDDSKDSYDPQNIKRLKFRTKKQHQLDKEALGIG